MADIRTAAQEMLDAIAEIDMSLYQERFEAAEEALRKALAAPVEPSIDALIAEIDELPTIYSDTAPSRPSYFKSDVQAILNKYRGQK